MASECEMIKDEARTVRDRGLKCVKIWKVSPGEGLLFLSLSRRLVRGGPVEVRRLPGRIAKWVRCVMLLG